MDDYTQSHSRPGLNCDSENHFFQAPDLLYSGLKFTEKKQERPDGNMAILTAFSEALAVERDQEHYI